LRIADCELRIANCGFANCGVGGSPKHLLIAPDPFARKPDVELAEGERNVG